MKTVRTLAAAAALLIVGAALTSSVGAQAAVSAPTPVVQGNRLVDTQTNTTFVPHGVNIPGLEYSCVQGWRMLPSAGEFAAIASWKINTVRLPLNESCWLGLDGAPTSGTVAQYKADVAAWVSGATAAGLAVILDLHWNAPAGYTASGQRAMPDERSAAFWTSVATTYASTKSVMFELFNEPYSRSGFTLTWECWKNGGCLAPVENDEAGTLSGTKYTVTGMQTLVSAVRTAGATQPILLGGLNYSNDLTGWLANKPTDPANQLVAAWHNYPGQGCSTSCWNSTVTTVAASVPIVTTEFGNTAETTSTVAGNSGNYLVPFMTWADAHGIGYMPWAWWDVPASESAPNSVYALYSGASFTPKSPSGTKFHDYLASLVTTPVIPVPQPNDLSGDGLADLLVKNADGSVTLHRGNGASGWAGQTAQPITFGGMSFVVGADDFNGDGTGDVIAVGESGGVWLYPGSGASALLGVKTKIGTGWTGLTAVIAPGDWDGDGHSDILTRDSAGLLWLHRGDGAAGWISTKTQIGSGWQAMTAIIAPGDFSGDGFNDLLARDSAGVLWLYRGTGAGSYTARVQAGTGWNSMNAIVPAGNFNGTGGSADIFSRDAAGVLWLYGSNGVGGFVARVQVGTGWSTRTLIP